MVKIQWLDRIAELQKDKTWKSNNKSFERVLNLIATPAQAVYYSPYIDFELLRLVKEYYPGIIILEGPEIPEEEEPDEPDTPY